MISVDELLDSRHVVTSTGQNPSAELHYFVKGTTSEVEARNILTAAAPATYDLFGTGLLFLPRSQIAVNPIGYELWEGILRYEVVPQTNQSTFTFDTGGGMQHVTNAIIHVGSYAPAGQVAPNHHGAIGVTASGVEGVDITVPVFHFTETHYLADSVVTDAYKGHLFNLTGTVNYAAFRGFASGECLFLGAAGAKRGCGDWEITFNFAASPNRVNLTIGDITGISKKGWEYLWIEYREVEDEAAKSITRRPIAVHIEQVYLYGDLALLGIGT